MSSKALLFSLLFCNALSVLAEEAMSTECTSSEDCASLNLLQTQMEFHRESTDNELGPCKNWCANKDWSVVCAWTQCSNCAPCTTTTTTTFGQYCSGATSFMQEVGESVFRSSPSEEDLAKKVERENQAMLFHHSYCGKSKQLSGQGRGSSAGSNSAGSRPPGNTIQRNNCPGFTSTRSPNGLANCDGAQDMPYAYAYHLHPTYDGNSKGAAAKLQAAFQANFNVKECEHVDEQTTYSTKERLCLLSTVKNCNKSPPASPSDVKAIFPLCQFGIYVRGGAMFDDTLGNDGTSPWQWMSLNKDCFGSPLDVLGHAVMCPSLAHGQWAFFVNGTHATTAATWITGSYSVAGCYGLECQPAECEVANAVLNGSAVYSSACCAVTALDLVPTGLDTLMAKTYSNVLKFQTSTGWWDVDDETMKGAGSYSPVFPPTVWPGGQCHGVCAL